MKTLFAVTALSLALAGCASTGGPSDRERFARTAGKPVANPSAVVKAELSFARLAREEGQWTAFRKTATADAVMFVPDLMSAQVWLKGKADPPTAVDWQPHRIYMSCDGSMGVSTGAWQGQKGTGYFTTIWQKQDAEERRYRGKEADWKWVLDHGESVDEPLAEPDFVSSEIASCKGDVVVPANRPIPGGKQKSGQSTDRTLIWVAEQYPDGRRQIIVSLWTGTAFEPVVTNKLAPPSS